MLGSEFFDRDTVLVARELLGKVLVREAGGLIGDLAGEDKFMDSGRIVASNGKLFAAILKVLHRR